jgi:hypothetical protein
MLLKAFFDKTAFVKFRIITIYKTLMEYIQNNQKSVGKSIPAYSYKKSQEKNPGTKSLETFTKMFVISKKKNKPKGMNLKIFRKSIA